MADDQLTLPADLGQTTNSIAEENLIEVAARPGQPVLMSGDLAFPLGLLAPKAIQENVALGFLTPDGLFQPYDIHNPDNPWGVPVRVKIHPLVRPVDTSIIPTDRNDFFRVTAESIDPYGSVVWWAISGSVDPLRVNNYVTDAFTAVRWFYRTAATESEDAGSWNPMPAGLGVRIANGTTIELYANIAGGDGPSDAICFGATNNIRTSGNMRSLFAFTDSLQRGDHIGLVFLNNKHLLESATVPTFTTASGDLVSYAELFSGCSNLTKISVYFTEWPDATEWVKNVSSTGVFYKPKSLSEVRDIDHIPEGWTVVESDPLPDLGDEDSGGDSL